MLRAVACLVLMLAACADDAVASEPDAATLVNPLQTCLDPLPRGPDDCALRFQPTFEAFYENLLQPTCGATGTGSGCHGPEGGMAGLFLHDREMAHAYLLGEIDGRPRVIPGDPECSLLVDRIESDDPNIWMPPGDDMLSAAERCSIITWIAMGAKP